MSGKIDPELLLLEERKIEALEKIAKVLDSFSMWFEEIDKEEWGDRIQYYLSEFHQLTIQNDRRSQTGGDSSVQE
tara:strand:+ start:272 stop:496 length:225 start_codon:yes stop_codon:yes gene_type:complete